MREDNSYKGPVGEDGEEEEEEASSSSSEEAEFIDDIELSLSSSSENSHLGWRLPPAAVNILFSASM